MSLNPFALTLDCAVWNGWNHFTSFFNRASMYFTSLNCIQIDKKHYCCRIYIHSDAICHCRISMLILTHRHFVCTLLGTHTLDWNILHSYFILFEFQSIRISFPNDDDVNWWLNLSEYLQQWNQIGETIRCCQRKYSHSNESECLRM